MKSTINQLVNYRDVEWEREVNVTCPQEYIDRQMKHLSRGQKRTEEVEILEKGDVAVLTLTSDLPKFNRASVPVTVGGGLYDRELEEQLVGHRLGEHLTLMVQGHPVQVQIEACRRTVFPKPTDEMVAEAVKNMEGMENVRTVEEYRARLAASYVEEQKQQHTFQVLDDILEYILTHSDWNFDEEEVEEVFQEEQEMLREELKQEKTSMEEMSAQTLKGYFGVETPEEVSTILRQEAERRIATALLLLHEHGKDSALYSLEQAEEEDWDFLINYVNEQIQFKEETK
jgi:hypothetical protein